MYLSSLLALTSLAACTPDVTDNHTGHAARTTTNATPLRLPTPIQGGYAYEGSLARPRLELGPEGARLDVVGAPLSLRTVGYGRDGVTVPFLAADVTEAECPDAMDCDSALARSSGAVQEWWLAEASGLHQGWTLTSAPAGEGLLHLDLALDATDWTVAPDGSGADIEVTTGAHLRYEGLAAYDADGTELSAWIEDTGDGLSVRVDLTGARFPVTVDPFLSTYVILTGPTAGSMLSNGTDLNGDGYKDFSALDPSTSTIYTWLGSASGISSAPSQTRTGLVLGADHIAAVSDVNGDGRDDMMVSASAGFGGRGVLFICPGTPTGLAPHCKLFATGLSTYRGLGSEIARFGDVNGDGYNDVGASDASGNVYLYRGGPGASYPALVSMAAVASHTVTGAALSGVGDVNGDGYADFAVGQQALAGGLGGLTVMYGSASGVGSSQAIAYPWPAGYGYCGSSGTMGYSVAAAGDYNGDNYMDVVAGAPHDLDLCGGGYAYVWVGGPSGVTTTSWVELYGTSSISAYASGSQAGRSDVNGDGIDDVVGNGLMNGYGGYFLGTNTPQYTNGTTEQLVAASGSYTDNTTNWALVVVSTHALGDLNGDGYDDIGSHRQDYYTAAEQFEVYYGAP